jgi:hypothetical protein
VRDRGAAADPDGPTGAGRAYWPEVARLLQAAYRSLQAAVSDPPVDALSDAPVDALSDAPVDAVSDPVDAVSGPRVAGR